MKMHYIVLSVPSSVPLFFIICTMLMEGRTFGPTISKFRHVFHICQHSIKFLLRKSSALTCVTLWKLHYADS